ncbi:hypothetical protein HYH03_011103 [Edaphochlamys debaryana]|uniref:Uncharacterized protein n=1 Tax=Edaphochlamys debaryana TaxID=47281 RepID=A0A835Y3P3_9CHLO|nr:hypothetical protein HYH03_011103 [Edaphochlamys debaryana]|eukprot:KAG2490474.1 hypothetical protein HYH03_011103 [Edaphochlamys debaryana]
MAGTYTQPATGMTDTTPGGLTGPTSGGGMGPGGGPGGLGGGTSGKDAKRITEGVNEEYHDPYDDWSSRDTLLALMPAIIVFCLQDSAFRVGLIMATALSFFLLVMRTVAWDSRYKKVWPMLELMQLPLFAILLGLSYVNYYQVNKWFPTITAITLFAMSVLTLLWRRAWTAHYARYPKFDRGGSLLWRHTPTWRRTSDMATAFWAVCFAVIAALSLLPQLLAGHFGANALNIIFNYIVPAVLVLAGLIHQQMLGGHYRNKTVRNLDRYFGRTDLQHVPGAGTMGTTGTSRDTYPSGPEVAGAGNV